MAKLKLENPTSCDRAVETLNKYNEYIKEVHTRFEELQNELSLYDRQQEDILHYIEYKKCDAVTNSKLMKCLREVRLKRREIKNEFDVVHTIVSRNAKEYNYAPPRKYKCRTDILKGFMGNDEIISS